MYDAPLKLVVDFGRYGNGKNYCKEGWREPDLTHTWTRGSCSTLELPVPDEPDNYLLRFDVSPPIAPHGGVIPQQLTVLVNEREVGQFAVDLRVSLECQISWQLFQTSSVVRVEFRSSSAEHPDASRHADTIGFATLVLFRAGVPATNPTVAGLAALSGRTGPPAAIDTRSSPSDRYVPPSGGNGYIDCHGYSEVAQGWFAIGAIDRSGPDKNEMAPDKIIAAVARFAGAELRGKPAIAFYKRSDLGAGWLGLVIFLPNDQPQTADLIALELATATAQLRLDPSPAIQSLNSEQIVGWVSHMLLEPDIDIAVRVLLLVSTAGREVDEQYYFARYPDVRLLGKNAAEHYLELGWTEHRDPTLWFCTKDYLNLYPDVQAQGHVPFYHYLCYGRKEGRKPHARSHEWNVVASEFDVAHYLAGHPDIAHQRAEPVEHYLEYGWKEDRDPAPWFSSAYYLKQQHDVRESGINPFYHYLRFGRAQRRKPCPTTLRFVKPLVSVIIPNYNHAPFLAERIDSVLNQRYDDVEILILDDASTDDSRDIIETYAQRYPGKIRTLYNEANSGSVFHQWRKGLDNVRGELVWMCESDDTCARDFLETLVPYFADPSIMLAFGRTQFIDAQGAEWRWLDSYRESSGPGIWDGVHVAPAFEWFRGRFAIRNVIPNVGGCIFRRQSLPDAVWAEAMQYRILGDWFLYAQIAGGGRLVYDPKAVAFFRQHAGNTSGGGMRQDHYWLEHLRLAKMLRARFGTPDDVSFRFYRILSDLYAEMFGEQHRHEMERLIDLDEILKVKRTQKHILIAIYGFHTGGGEVFAIHLANQLLELGHLVSVACVKEHPILDNDGIRQMLDSRIAVYEREVIDKIGPEAFLASAGVDVIHSHFLESEHLFLSANKGRLPTPYVVTLHGAYEAYEEMGHILDDADLLAFVRGVDYWVYLSQNNLGHLQDIPIEKERMILLPNAVRINDAPFPYNRSDIGAGDDAIIFGIASRAIEDKGWEESILALQAARRTAGRRLMLLLCGDGPELDRLELLYRDDRDIRFFGFQQNIHGFYRLCDCCLLPTRFVGESFPLTLIQSFQVGTPAIATDVGEIRSMIEVESRSAGVLLRLGRRDAFIRDLTEAMLKMSDDGFRFARSEDAAAIGTRYDMVALAQQYLSIYAKAGDWEASE